MNAHRRILRSGLLHGDLDEATRMEWPEWAKVHVGECPRCRAIIEADSLLESVFSPGSTNVRLPTPPAPSLADLEEYLEARSLPAPRDLADSGRAFPRLRYRAIPLEIGRTDRGLRVWHPLARSVVVYALPHGRFPVLLHASHTIRPGMHVDIPFEPEAPQRVVALAAPGPLDAEIWGFWLAEWCREHPDAVLPPYDPENHVHFAWISFPVHAWACRWDTARRPSAASRCPVGLSIRRATLEDRIPDIPAAAAAYRQALDAAHDAHDPAGEAEALLGLAVVCRQQGLLDDADRILADLVERCPLDPPLSAWVHHTIITIAFARDDLDTVEFWLEHSTSLQEVEPLLFLLHELRLARARGIPAWVVRLASSLQDVSLLPGMTRALLEATHAEALAILDKPALARAALEGPESLEPAPLELLLLRALAQGVIATTEGSSFDWSEVAREAAHVLRSRPTECRGVDAERLMVEAAARALASGDPQSASMLLRLRFLHPDAALDDRLPLLAVVGLSCITLVHHLDGSVGLHPLGRPDLASLATQAREEMQAGLPGRALSRLEGLLLPLGAPEGPFLFGSDGSLAEIPLRALVGLALPDGHPLVPCLVIIDPLGAPPVRTGGKRHQAIASFADATGDLPGAAREVLRREATRWFRGQAATIEHLRNLGPVGLLHLGLRTIRDRGFPELQFADGLLCAPEVAGLGLEGNPVVLLTGCATLAGTACLGAERSMASALLAAGASAVIATRWPVPDAEMRHFARALVARWPFTDAAAVVAEVASSLKEHGFAPRLWAAPVVYARSPGAGPGTAACHQGGTHRHPSGAERSQSASSARERSGSWDGMAGPE